MENLRQYWATLAAAIGDFRLNNRMAFNVVAAALGLAAALAMLFYMLAPGAPVVLSSYLTPADRTALALRLRRHHIDFDLGPDSISVPASQLSQAQALLANQPGFPGGASGFGLFDRSTLGQSDFDEQVAYQRSLQGELERTIMDIRGIESARVMLAMGQPSPFALGPEVSNHASVLLTTVPGGTLDAAMAGAIAHLVASSVQGLKPDDVTVTGNDGQVLYPVPHGDEVAEALRVQNQIEQMLRHKAAALLSSITGSGRFSVEVSVNLDTSKVSSRQESYEASHQALVSAQSSTSPGATISGGIPGLTSNLPGLPASSPTAPPAQASGPGPSAPKAAAAKQSSPVSHTQITNYFKPSSRETTRVAGPLRIKRVSVAAVLDGTYEGNKFKPLAPQRLQEIRGLLVDALGLEKARGDSVDVQSAALSHPYVPPVLGPLSRLRARFGSRNLFYAGIGSALLVLLMLVRVIFRLLRKLFGRRRIAANAEPAIASDNRPALEAGGEGELARGKPSAYELIRQQINQQVAHDPQAAAQIVRKWLASESAGSGGDNSKEAA